MRQAQLEKEDSMSGQLQIVSPSVKLSVAMQDAVVKHVAYLEKQAGFCRGIRACHVTIDQEGHSEKDRPFNVRVHAVLGLGELNATHHENRDFYAALNAAFEALLHQLHARERSPLRVSVGQGGGEV